MVETDYKAMVENLRKRLAEIDAERAEIEARRSDLEKETASIKEALSHLLPLCGEIFDPNDLSGAGFTNAIRSVLASYVGKWLSASEVRESLGQRGFQLSVYSNPMASIYKILSRLVESGEIESKSEGANVFYRTKPEASLLERVALLDSKKRSQ